MTATDLSYLGALFSDFPNDFNLVFLAWALDMENLHAGGLSLSHTGGSMDLLRIVIVFSALALVVDRANAQSSGNDVYNFYFQKGAAPQSVVQGGGGQTATAPPPTVVPAVEAPVTSTLIAKEEPKKVEMPKRDYHGFELHLGPTRVRDEVGDATAYTVGAQTNFNRYLGMRLQGHYLAVESADYQRPIADRDQASNRYGGQAAFVFTPLRMDLVGHKLIRVAGLVGVRSDRRFRSEVSAPLEDQKVKTHLQGFVGASVGVSLNENVGIEGSVAMVDGGKIGQATGSIVFSF